MYLLYSKTILITIIKRPDYSSSSCSLLYTALSEGPEPRHGLVAPLTAHIYNLNWIIRGLSQYLFFRCSPDMQPMFAYSTRPREHLLLVLFIIKHRQTLVVSSETIM